MAFEKSFDDPVVLASPACIHLRSKAMCVTGATEMVHPDEAGSNYCWCNISQHVVGPDQSDVCREQCVSGRECYRNTH